MPRCLAVNERAGPGYRVYYLQQGDQLVLLLCGGDNSTQGDDIATAKQIANQWKDTNNDERNR